MRILVAISPQMYRQVIVLFIHEQCPGHEVRKVSPERSADEVARFRPHLLVRNDTDGLGTEALASIPFWVEIRYSDGLDARVSADGQLSEVNDISMEDLLGILDRAATSPSVGN